jgi:hypothetical protein
VNPFDPPEAANVCEYATVASPLGKGEAVVIVGAGLTVSVSGWLLDVALLASVT